MPYAENRLDNAASGHDDLGYAASNDTSVTDAKQARDHYLDRLSALLGDDRAKMIASAWSGNSIPSWLQEKPEEIAAVRPARRRRDGLSMIRQTTMLCVTAAFGSCLFLYWGKSQATMADREIGRILRATQEAHARVVSLRSEWALLNEPDRLKDMADHYLKLQPVAPSQFAEVSGLPGRLQAPVETPADGSPAAEAALASYETQAADQGQSAHDIQASGETPAAAETASKVASPAMATSEPVVATQRVAVAEGAEHVAALDQDAVPETAQPVVAKPAAARLAPAELGASAPEGGNSFDQHALRGEPAADAVRHPRPHGLARAMPDARAPTPMIAEARQPVRVRDSGEALLNAEPEAAHAHPHVMRAAYAAMPAPSRSDQIRPLRHQPPSRIDLPHWLMEAHLVRSGRSDPPHALGIPQSTPIPLAAPQPEAATLQRVVARSAPEQEHPPIPEAPSTGRRAYEPSNSDTRDADEAPRYRPTYRQNYAYANPYRSYYGQNYGGQNYGGQNYGGQNYNRGYYGGQYGGGGYGNPYYRNQAYREDAPPPPPNGYYPGGAYQ